MHQVIEKHGILNKPVKFLIGSYRGDKILLATLLLQWYLNNGLEVKKVYHFILYVPKRCFETFVNKITEKRQATDASGANTQIVANTMKLLGNSFYGKTLTNKRKHMKVSYVDNTKIYATIKEPTFRHLNEISPTCFEVASSPKTITEFLPSSSAMDFHHDKRVP